MVLKVTNHTYYHVNSNANLSPHPLMAPGDQFQVGETTNPFFRFYEVYQRRYPVTQHPHGTVVQVPAMKFLTRVKDGTITTQTLPKIAWETANHFLMLARELVWENVRIAEFPDAPSRQRCIWLIESLDEAKQWPARMGFQPHTYSIVRMRGTGKALRVDSNLLAGDSELLGVWFEKARAYWKGEDSENPLSEVLFEGSLDVDEIVNIAAPISTQV